LPENQLRENARIVGNGLTTKGRQILSRQQNDPAFAKVKQCFYFLLLTSHRAEKIMQGGIWLRALGRRRPMNLTRSKFIIYNNVDS